MISPMRRTLAWIPLLLACAAPCPTDPLVPAPDARFAVRFHEPPAPPMPDETAGMETFSDPPGVATYAAFALYDEAGQVVAERWLDTFTPLDAVIGTVNAATRFATRTPDGQLTLLLADGLRPALRVDVATGEPTLVAPTWVAAPTAAGQLVDLAPLPDGTALATRRRAPDGLGGDLVRLDVANGGAVLESVALSALSSGRVEPGTVAVVEGRAVIGLSLLDEPGAGAVAVYDLERATVERVDVPGLSNCAQVVRLASGRVGALCAGDLADPARAGVGFARIEATLDAPPAVLDGRPESTLFRDRAPTGALVALSGEWVAAVSRGDPTSGRPDALIAVDLASDAATLLLEAPFDEAFGGTLGAGAFAGGALWWPSARGVIYRFAMTGEDAAATFDALEPASPPGCFSLSPRAVSVVGPAPSP